MSYALSEARLTVDLISATVLMTQRQQFDLHRVLDGIGMLGDGRAREAADNDDGQGSAASDSVR
ncbi:MAG: hypothetical protein ACRD0W_08290 [Acidimicrobiales bacterium]